MDRYGKNAFLQVVDMYDKLSRYEGEEGVVIVYGTMYGNTEELAEAIAEELKCTGHQEYHSAQCFSYASFLYPGRHL